MTGAVLKLAAKPIDFAQLYRQSVERIWRVVTRLGVRAADVEDAVQDVYVVAHKRLDSLRPDVSPVTWLTGIAVKVAHDHRRTVQRKPTGPLEPASHVADAAVGPDELAVRRDALGFALRLLDQLEPAQRDVFVLIEFEQLSAPEVAEVTSAPLNTVYSRLRLARARFNELVAAQEVP